MRICLDEQGMLNRDILQKEVRKYYEYNNTGALPTLIYRTQPEHLKTPDGDTSSRGKMIYIFENTTPYDFLRSKYKIGTPTASDLKILEYLAVELNMTPAVINVLIDYVLKINNNKLTKAFIETIAGQWARLGIKTAREAMKEAEKEYKKKPKKEEFWALKDVSFEVEKGEVIGFIGSNGAGKSTMLKVIAGVMKPTTGKVTVNGNICPMIELGAGFDMELTARENIYLNGAVLGYSKDFIEQKFDEIVEFSELKEFLDVPVRNFSSGMTARLAFSIATVVDPEILIVDEILSVGDIAFQKKSEAKMKSMIGGGTTVLFVSHSLAQIEKICNRVVWLDHGKVVKIGDAKEICQEYYDSQLK